MLAITQLSSGRLGNRLFHYNLLRQLARRTDVGYFHIRFPESRYFEGLSRKRRPWPSIAQPIKLSSSDVLASHPDQFLASVKELTLKGIDIHLSPPMLGETFFDFLFYDPNDFIEIKPAYRAPLLLGAEVCPVIAIHFRGGDFPAWNPKAALGFAYYEAAISCCLEHFQNQEVIFSLFTDDIEYPAYLQTIAFLGSLQGVRFATGKPQAPPAIDLYQMSQASVLISSPSTFAIFGGILGRRKLIVHSSTWLEYALNKGDRFWLRLAETENPYYRLWKTI